MVPRRILPSPSGKRFFRHLTESRYTFSFDFQPDYRGVIDRHNCGRVLLAEFQVKPCRFVMREVFKDSIEHFGSLRQMAGFAGLQGLAEPVRQAVLFGCRLVAECEQLVDIDRVGLAD